jgi:hypothetical protein
VPHDKLKDAARALAAREGLSYVDARRRLARRAVIDHHFQQHIEVDAHTTLLRVTDVADRVAAEGRADRLLLGLTWGEGSLWADLPARGGHVGVVESGFAGSRALCRHLALQARAHGADVHLLVPGASAAYPGMDAVGDPEECRRRLADLEGASPTAQRPVYAVIDNPHALGEDTPTRGIAHTRIHRLLTRAPEHLHVVLRCDRPTQTWPLEAFAVVAVTGVLASTWRTVVGEPISEAATSGPDMWTFLTGPAHRGQGVLDCALDPGGERVVAFVPGAPDVPAPSASRHPHDGQVADRDWARHARVRIRAAVDRYSPEAGAARFEAGEVLRMHQAGQGGYTVSSAWWTTHHLRGTYMFRSNEVSIVEELTADSPIQHQHDLPLG